jgi:hypothetical protein
MILRSQPCCGIERFRALSYFRAFFETRLGPIAAVCACVGTCRFRIVYSGLFGLSRV